ncbi:MAG: ATP-binding cassette domain-containing protein [Anaerolineae bacterium]|nr:ATP-binding cassette domain-containing protein [Anaerolineae bacterium]
MCVDITVPLVTLDNVSYIYPHTEKPALHDVTLDIGKGEFLGLIGPTGAGKTTLCLSLSGIVPQFYGGCFFGHITVAGMDTLGHPVSHLARHVGSVFEDPETQLTATSVENEIAFALENLSVPREEILARIPRALEAARLEGIAKKHPRELSGGQKQRLAIAAALAVQPDILVLDEPTSQLDPMGAQEVFATVRELNKTLGITVVMAGHAAEELAEYADRLALLVDGKLVAVGPPDDLYAQVDRLEGYHVRPPQVAQTFAHIRQVGVTVPAIPVHLTEGIAALKAAAQSYPIQAPPISPTKTAKQGTPLLSARNLTYVYGDGTVALRDVSFDVHTGEYLLIVGQNGAGKSTLAKHFLCLLLPTSGAVLVDGTDTRDLTTSALARRIGYVAQNPDNQIFNTTVEAEVAFALKNLAYPAEEVKVRTEESLAAMGLLEHRSAHPLVLPKGDRARVVIAAILAMRPDIVIFDEPTTGQDYRGARAILDISKQLHAAGKTVIVITHHLYLMPEYAERVVVMGKGTLLLNAPIREVYHAVDVLASTYIIPPQVVLLARALAEEQQVDFPLLTPEEVAACFAKDVYPRGTEFTEIF